VTCDPLAYNYYYTFRRRHTNTHTSYLFDRLNE
jgi:hypothetical protein